MDRDTFTAGVVPGGLTDHTEIKILICHVLDEAGPLRDDDLFEAFTGRGYANYFECADALSGLADAGHITQQDGIHAVTDAGAAIARELIDSVPLTVRERVLGDARSLAHRARALDSHKTSIIESGAGYRVRCAVCDSSGSEHFALELEVSSQRIAQKIRRNFVDHAEDILRYAISKLCDEEL